MDRPGSELSMSPLIFSIVWARLLQDKAKQMAQTAINLFKDLQNLERLVSLVKNLTRNLKEY
jgi:hypothetical protein